MSKSDQAGRFDRGARWHLILMAALLLFAVTSTIYRFTLPTDGWLSAEPEGFDSYGFIYQRDIMGSPSALQPGDIDVIIRKTLLYTATSALLALVFFGSVILLQRGFEAVTGQQSQLAIVLSTLAIAALFNPLRARMQRWIDRRFYRKKYDSQQVLARFAITARDETYMQVLTAELAHVVQKTMAPKRVNMWLQGDGRRRESA